MPSHAPPSPPRPPHTHTHTCPAPLSPLQARWLLWVMAQGDEAAALSAFSLIPEAVVRDLAAWLGFLIYNQATEVGLG